MRLMVTGSRTITDRGDIELAMHFALDSLELHWGDCHTLIHGDCRGVDRIAARIAASWGWEVIAVPAEWRTHGRAAGPIRNRQMAEMADACLALIRGNSRGTADAIRAIEALGKRLVTVEYD